jgi:hypothetical protein
LNFKAGGAIVTHLVSHRITRRWFAVLLACVITAIAVAGFRTSAFSPAPPVLPGLYYTVTSTADNTDVVIHGGTGTAADPFQMSSLRGAVLNANTQITSVVGPITISVPAGTYLLSVSNPDTPAVTGTTSFQDLEVGSGFNQNTTIVGVGGTPRIEQTVSGNDVITTGYADASYTPQAVNLTLQNLEITGGSFSGIFTGVDNGTGLSNTTIVGCNVHDNSDPFGPGGGIFNQTGNLSVQNSTFSNNTASTQGGAIFYDLPNAAGPGSTGTLAVSGSRFSNNQASAGSGFPAGGAIFIDAAGTGNSLSIINSNFEANSATGGGSGGAVALVSNNGVSVTLSRFAGNVSSGGGSGLASIGSGAISAINNWWGCDNFPGSAGCDTVSGSAITSPRIDLVVTSGAASVCTGQTTPVTASFNTNSANAPISPTSLDGKTVTFTVVGTGSVSPTSAVVSGGTAGTTFTGGATSTNVSATLDNGTQTISIASGAATTTSDPADQAVCEGGTATFSTTASGPVTFVWKKGATVLNNGDLGGRVTISSGSNSSTLSISNVQASDADTYTVEATGSCGTATQSATLTINAATTTTDPADQTVCQGTDAHFSTTAGGTGPFHYAWTLDGSPFNGDSPSITVPTGSLSSGNHPVTVTTTGACGSAFQSATLTVGSSAITAIGPANVWIGLKNSDDVGTKFDLLAEVLQNNVVIGSGQINDVPGGSSGFNNAVQRTIAMALSGSGGSCSGGTLSFRLSVRIAASSGHVSGTARLWFNDSAANSRFDATIGSTAHTYYLLDGFVLGSAAGPGPRKSIDVTVSRNVGGNPFKPFGTWSTTF